MSAPVQSLGHARCYIGEARRFTVNHNLLLSAVEEGVHPFFSLLYSTTTKFPLFTTKEYSDT